MSASLPPLPPIPTPPAIRWRELRLRILPAAVFGAGLVLAAAIWSRAVAPPTFVGEAELVQTDVRAVQAGTLAALEVDLLQPVASGAVIGRLLPSDPKVLAASLAVIQAEVGLLRMSLEPALAGRRVVLEHARLRLEWMHERVTLAALRAQLLEAETSLGRLSPLHERSVVAEEQFTTAQHLRDGLVAQIAEQNRLIGALEPSLGGAPESDTSLQPASAEATLLAAIRVQDEKLRLTEAQLGPVELRAPIGGIVTMIRRRSGETVAAGESVATIAAVEPVRIIGYLRQPLGRVPRVGQPVEIRTRSLPRRAGRAAVEHVGRVLEPLPATFLAAHNRTGAVELGLPVHLRVPAELALRPGECVDVILRGDGS